MAIILYELTYSYHRWKFAIKPWRNNKNSEKLPSIKWSETIIGVSIVTSGYYFVLMHIP